VAAAGHHHDVARIGLFERHLDRAFAVELDPHETRGTDAVAYRGGDRLWILVARLSLVRMTRSATAAAAPMRGLFALSRFPPAPNTTVSDPEHRWRAVASVRARASGVCAKSTTTSGRRATNSKRPEGGAIAEIARAASSGRMPEATAAMRAAMAFSAKISPMARTWM
jgi:hypothetical protein